MSELVGKYALIFFASMFKFIGGPMLGAKWGYSIITTALFTILGASTAVVVFAFVGDSVRVYLQKKREKKQKQQKVFTKKKRKIINIYNRFGIRGIAFFTPLILTPIGGTIVALSFGVPRKKIISNMIISICIWGFILSTIVILFWNEIQPLISK